MEVVSTIPNVLNSWRNFPTVQFSGRDASYSTVELEPTGLNLAALVDLLPLRREAMPKDVYTISEYTCILRSLFQNTLYISNDEYN